MTSNTHLKHPHGSNVQMSKLPYINYGMWQRHIRRPFDGYIGHFVEGNGYLEIRFLSVLLILDLSLKGINHSILIPDELIKCHTFEESVVH